MNIIRPNDIASLIRDHRTANGLSQADLANSIGVSRKWVNELEGGGGSAKIGLVLRALNELGITLHAYGPDQTPLVTDEAPGKELQMAIDIDAIADMGLETIEDKATETPRPQRKRKPRR